MLGQDANELLNTLREAKKVIDKFLNAPPDADAIVVFNGMCDMKDLTIRLEEMCSNTLSLEEQKKFCIENRMELMWDLFACSKRLLVWHENRTNPRAIPHGNPTIERENLTRNAINIDKWFISPLIRYITGR